MSETLEFEVRAEPMQVREVRQQVREALEPRGVDEKVVDTLVLVLDELLNNAIEHGRGYRSDEDLLLVRLDVEGGDVRVEFQDPSVPAHVVGEIEALFEQVKESVPPPFFERGRGLFLIQDGFDQLQLESLDGGVGMAVSGRIAPGD